MPSLRAMTLRFCENISLINSIQYKGRNATVRECANHAINYAVSQVVNHPVNHTLPYGRVSAMSLLDVSGVHSKTINRQIKKFFSKGVN